MHVWRVLCLCCLALLGGCLVSFEQGIPPEEAAPMPLLGDWQRQNEWGESQYLSISHAGAQRYRARLADDDDKFEEYPFTVRHHGRRWYLSAELPERLGGRHAWLGFELTRGNELVLFSLDIERVMHDVEEGRLAGSPFDTEEGEGLAIASPLHEVLGYLDDPANAGLFVEVARFQRRAD
ncbi:MAG: hypothetical protein E6Q70_23485 [Pseudomonas monteilii]|nr:MAG: hypothetical protein E6Q70_23485 [Pseudomonas monteilii]